MNDNEIMAYRTVSQCITSDYAKGYNEAVENANKIFKNLQAQIAHIKRHVKSDNSDYLTGYISALSAVEGMIEKVRCDNNG